MSNQLVKMRGERGMTTAEYALGTIAVVALLAVIVGMISSGPFKDQLFRLAETIITYLVAFVA
jgi:hypothetical protein